MNSTTKNRLMIAAVFMLSVVQANQTLFGQSSRRGRLQQDIMDTSQFSLLDYRRMMKHGTTPLPHELLGNWHGVNKGIVELVGYKQFVKEIQVLNDRLVGDNIQVHQVSPNQIRLGGWEPKFDSATGKFERKGKFEVKPPSHRGRRGKSAIISYRDGDNRRGDPVRLLVDKVVKLDDDHMLGRATANFGPVRIPLAYFVLERVHESAGEPSLVVNN